MPRRVLVSLIALLVAAAGFAAWHTDVFPLLASTVKMGRQPGDIFLLPTHQLVRPASGQAEILGRPVDAALHNGLGLVAVLNTRNVVLLDAATLAVAGEVKTTATSYAGVAFRPGTQELWISETARSGGDAIHIATIGEGRRVGESRRIPIATGHPVPSGIAFSADGAKAYVAYSRANSLAVFDAAAGTLEREIPVGMAPFGVVVSARHKRIFVTNRGGRRARPGDTLAPTSGAEVASNPSTGATATGTLSVIDAATYAVREVAVGLAPSSMALSPGEDLLVVANGHSDSVTLINTSSLKTEEIKLPAFPEGSFGSLPIAGAFSPDGRTLYVACGGNNALAVLRKRGRWTLEGFYPTGAFPTALLADARGALTVVNLRGQGPIAGSAGTYNSRAYQGTVQRLPALSAGDVAAGSQAVRQANQPRWSPAGGIENLQALGIRHVFFIIKENRTYDQVFGALPQGNGDPKLVHYGRAITPNHHALAEEYVLLDNFYTTGAISFDGHHWLTQAFVSDYVERAFAASPRGYAWNLSDALVVSPAGFFWQSARRPLDVRIYGEFCLPARWDPARQQAVDINEYDELPWAEYWRLYKENRWRTAVGSRSGVPALQKFINPRYPNSTMQIPDQIRAEAFLEDFAELEKAGRLPNLFLITLNSDHTSGTRPGAPTPRAMVADNDLALGRIVEAVSNSPIWERSLILVTEDDAQDGVDHVHGHRTVALAVGPHVARKKVDSNHYTHGSMVRTIQAIFGIPAATRYLQSARPMSSVFEATARPARYKALVPEVALDEMNPPLKALDGRRLWAARASAAMNFHDLDDVPHETLNRILWWDSKGWDTPFPELPKRPLPEGMR
jgi:YVTN family beta-propeller protein